MSGDQKCPFPIVRIENHTALELFLDYMLGNKPVILHANTTANWLSRRKWVISQDSNVADLRYFRERFGEMVVPEIDGKQCDYETMRLRDFIDYLEDENSRKKSDYKYVKDWHFQKESGTEYAAYQLPSFLKFDWINNEEWSATEANPLGDYRFVYFGIKGSWTVYHSDVMSSYSWSANICGRKLWYFTPPGKEELFRKDRCSFLKDIRERQGVWKEACVSSFIQQPGEIVFVPSNWYHQVHNLEDAISINHNFINASNVDLVYGLICQRLTDVIEEISDARADFTPQEFSDQCQLILKADIRINFDILRQLVELVFEDRIKSATSCWVCPKHLSCIFECKKDSECIERTRQVLLSNCRCYNSEICHSCTSFMCSYELSCAFEDANSGCARVGKLYMNDMKELRRIDMVKCDKEFGRTTCRSCGFALWSPHSVQLRVDKKKRLVSQCNRCGFVRRFLMNRNYLSRNEKEEFRKEISGEQSSKNPDT